MNRRCSTVSVSSKNTSRTGSLSACQLQKVCETALARHHQRLQPRRLMTLTAMLSGLRPFTVARTWVYVSLILMLDDLQLTAERTHTLYGPTIACLSA